MPNISEEADILQIYVELEQYKTLWHTWNSDFIWDFRKLHFPSHMGKYFIKIWKICAKIHEIEKIKASYGLGRTPV